MRIISKVISQILLITLGLKASILVADESVDSFDATSIAIETIAYDDDDEFYTVGAVGDSITTAFNAFKVINNKPLSWSSGSDIDQKVLSHYFRLKKIYKEKVFRSYNFAFPGKTSEVLLEQVQKLNRHKPDYVAFTIGTNDICHAPTDLEFNVEHFKSNLRKSINTLIRQNSDIKIVISLIPNVLQVREFESQSKTCELLRKVITFAACSAALNPNLTEEEVEAFQRKWVVANEALNSMNTEFPANVRVAPVEVANTRFDLEDISNIDCFHPSIKGQNKIARLTWDHGWFK